jgi:hypothetical protein
MEAANLLCVVLSISGCEVTLQVGLSKILPIDGDALASNSVNGLVNRSISFDPFLQSDNC